MCCEEILEITKKFELVCNEPKKVKHHCSDILKASIRNLKFFKFPIVDCKMFIVKGVMLLTLKSRMMKKKFGNVKFRIPWIIKKFHAIFTTLKNPPAVLTFRFTI